jgi:hypothetical protein
MYRNRLEILSQLLIAKSLAKYFTIGVCSWLSSWLNKYNYMEYIKGNSYIYKSVVKSLFLGHLKVLYRVFLTRVLASAKKC